MTPSRILAAWDERTKARGGIDGMSQEQVQEEIRCLSVVLNCDVEDVKQALRDRIVQGGY